MGFLDSFFSGVSDFASGFGSVLETAFASPLGTAVLTTGTQIGVEALRKELGLTTTVSGSPMNRGPAPSVILDPRSLAEELLFFQPGGPGTAVRGDPTGTLQFSSPARPLPLSAGAFGPGRIEPRFAAPPPSIPASQPFGIQPGTQLFGFGGPGMAAFPTTTQASFPPSAFAQATQAGFALPALSGLGALARQLPGFVGGIVGGELLGSALAGGGGGTPPFRATMAGARAQFFRTQNPATGQDTWFRPAGRPLFWSGDLTACKRVNKIARRAKRKR